MTMGEAVDQWYAMEVSAALSVVRQAFFLGVFGIMLGVFLAFVLDDVLAGVVRLLRERRNRRVAACLALAVALVCVPAIATAAVPTGWPATITAEIQTDAMTLSAEMPWDDLLGSFSVYRAATPLGELTGEIQPGGPGYFEWPGDSVRFSVPLEFGQPLREFDGVATVAIVPEPASLSLASLVGLMWLRRRR